MNKVIQVLRNEQGQGMLEYVVGICGAIALAAAAIVVLKTNGTNATNSVTSKVTSAIS